jgi:hypothetical protein
MRRKRIIDERRQASLHPVRHAFVLSDGAIDFISGEVITVAQKRHASLA